MARESAGEGFGRTTYGVGLVLLALVLIGATVALWGPAADSAGSGVRDTFELGLFAIAGALGATMRGIAYLLASASFSARQFRQWRLESLISPVLGAIAGIAVYLVVLASIVRVGGINPAGQYLVSVVAGTSALTLFGRIAERGLLRSGTNRSGILGGEVSPSIPMLDRIDSLLEQRVADLTIVDYRGSIVLVPRRLNDRVWQIDVLFDDEPPSSLPNHGVSRRIEVSGGVQRDVVPFIVSVTSDWARTVPAELVVSAPRRGSSPPSTLLVELTEPDYDRSRIVTVQVGQNSQIVQAIALPLEPL